LLESSPNPLRAWTSHGTARIWLGRRDTRLIVSAAIVFLLSVRASFGAGEWPEDFEPLAQQDLAPAQEGYFNALIFGAGNAATARRELNLFLHQRIAETDLICGLSEGQKKKLDLAGRGEIKRLFDRIDERRRKFLDVEGDAGVVTQQVLDDAAALRDAVRSDPLERGPLFSKIWARTLTADQSARSATFAATDRITGVRLASQTQDTDEVREVRFPATPFGDSDLARVARLTTLQNLILDTTRVTDPGLARLAGLTNLRELDLGDTRIDGSGLAHLKELKDLRALDLRRTPLNGDNLVHLRPLIGLRRLYLQETLIRDSGIVHLAAVTGLTELSLRHTRVTDAGLASLNELVNLRQLDLDGTRVTDAGLIHLTGMNKLEVLDLRGTLVTDEGIARLGALGSLRHVYLFDTAVTDAGIASLQRSLPSARLMR
jgi:hypothetical protein